MTKCEPVDDRSHVPVEPIRYTCRFTLEEIEEMAITGVVPDPVRAWFKHGAEVLRGERTDFLRCEAMHPQTGWKCWLPKGHDGNHSALLPTGVPWLGERIDATAPRTDSIPRP